MFNKLTAAGAVLAAVLPALGAPTSAAAFDARNPADILSVLVTNGASGEMKQNPDGSPFIQAKAGTLNFSVEFYRCNTDRNSCGTVIYQIGWDSELVNVDQVNAWNRWTMLCPAYLTDAKHPHAWYGVKVSASDTREVVAAQQQEWLKCLSDFDHFTSDPDGFIKATAK